MTATDLLSITDAATLRRKAVAAWCNGNDTGNGFAVGVIGADINDLADDLGTLIVRADNDRQVAIYEDHDGSVVLVGDAHGPWAVRVR